MKENFGNEDKNTKSKNVPDRCCCFPAERLIDLNLGSGSTGPFTVTEGTVFTLPQAVNVVSVPVNADECRIDPRLKEGCCRRSLRVLLTFIADISLNTLAISTTLSFYLVRSSCKGTMPIGPLPTFVITTGIDLREAVTHAFEYLDKDIEPSDYTYSVRLAPGSTVTGEEDLLGASVTINSATLSAIAAFV